MFLLTGILFSLLLVIIAAYLWHIKPAYEFFTKLNIPGPAPTLFFGNFLDVIKSRRLSLTVHQWAEKYGRIFGYFEGHTPILVVSDPDISTRCIYQIIFKFSLTSSFSTGRSRIEKM